MRGISRGSLSIWMMSRMSMRTSLMNIFEGGWYVVIRLFIYLLIFFNIFYIFQYFLQFSIFFNIILGWVVRGGPIIYTFFYISQYFF